MPSRTRFDFLASDRYPRRVSLAATAIVVCVLASNALSTELINNGALNVISAASPDLEVRDGATATTLNVIDGAIIDEVPEQDPPLDSEGRSIGVFGTSILNLMGGETVGSVEFGDSAIGTHSAGKIGNDLTARDSSSVLITGTANIDDDVFLSGTTRFTMTGGEVGDQFFATGSAIVSLSESAGPINDDLFISESARLEMAGGSLGDELFVQGNATAAITGGHIDDDLNANDAAIIQVNFVEIADSVDATGSGVVHFHGGVVGGGFSASDTSTINITGGTFEGIFGDEGILAAGGEINILGGVFGTAGASGGTIAASLGGEVNFTGGTIVGVADGNAPLATVSAVLNGAVNLRDLAFGNLALDAANNGVVVAESFEADSVRVSSIAGGRVDIVGGTANDLSVFAELGGQVTLSGGDFGDIAAVIESGSRLIIVGNSFVVNGIPIEDLDATLKDPDAFIETTGEVRLVAGDIVGVLDDGSPFAISFTRQFATTAATQLYLRTIPEPNASLLLVLGAGFAFGIVRRHER